MLVVQSCFAGVLQDACRSKWLNGLASAEALLGMGLPLACMNICGCTLLSNVLDFSILRGPRTQRGKHGFSNALPAVVGRMDRGISQ